MTLYILGLHNDEDSGVCLLADGVILDVLNEERLSRVKLHKGLPERSLALVLERNGVTIDDIDLFVYGWYGRQNDFPEFVRRFSQRFGEAVAADPDCVQIMLQRLDAEIERDAATRAEFEAWMGALGVPDAKLAFVDHHHAHAWSTFAFSPFDEAYVFTMDGRGDMKSGSVSYANRTQGVRELDYNLTVDSLGFLYGQITHYLGFTPHRHEGKVTGLAAYGDAARTLPIFERLIEWRDDHITASVGRYRPFYTNLHADVVAELDGHNREDVAAGLQAHCERLACRYVSHVINGDDRADAINVCLAGGLFANVRINQQIAELDCVDNIFVFPHMGDGGLPCGSAAAKLFELTGRTKIDMPTVYLGPSYGDDEISALLGARSSSIVYAPLDDRVAPTVADLRDGRVVGFFDGRMEFGPRALGARSILYHTRDASVNDWLNRRLKRTEFMPFAPVTPVELAADCYLGWREDHVSARFMTRTYDCATSFAKAHPAVVHVDGTARPQVVSAALNGTYYEVVKRYCDETGEKALINTSFNQHEEPIVCTPEDALGGLLKDNVDVLIMGDYRITRGNS